MGRSLLLSKTTSLPTSKTRTESVLSFFTINYTHCWRKKKKNTTALAIRRPIDIAAWSKSTNSSSYHPLHDLSASPQVKINLKMPSSSMEVTTRFQCHSLSILHLSRSLVYYVPKLDVHTPLITFFSSFFCFYLANSWLVWHVARIFWLVVHVCTYVQYVPMYMVHENIYQF